MSEGIDQHEKRYSTLVTRWHRDQDVNVFVEGCEWQSFYIPYTWLQQSKQETWHFVQDIIGVLVNERGTLVTMDGTPLDMFKGIEVGEYRFTPREVNTTFTWRTGPSNARGGPKAENAGDDESSVGKSENTQQREFRDQLVGRDRSCLITGDLTGNFEAAHIVPKARRDVYAQVLSKRINRSVRADSIAPFHTSQGLLLRDDMHSTYDRYYWSLYHKDKVYYVHVFNSTYVDARFHGYEIKRSTHFHPRCQDDELPDPDLCRWHYQQCVMLYLRGFSSGMAYLRR